jgi:tRNA threonylcarbamoyladenosine biosynthesis protein TsaB
LVQSFDFSSMILLAIDTSGKAGSIALARSAGDASAAGGGSPSVEILDVIPLEGGTFSAQLVPQIAALLQKHGLKKEQIDGFAVASGPGSFTGLRVGLAAVKGLAEILGKPIVAISRLEVVARSAKCQGKVMAALDAGRSDVYLGEYDLSERAEIIGERLISREEFLSIARETKVLTPERALIEATSSAGLSVEEVAPPDSAAVARMGFEKIMRGETTSPEGLEANYIRRSDAEIFAKK